MAHLSGVARAELIPVHSGSSARSMHTGRGSKPRPTLLFLVRKNVANIREANAIAKKQLALRDQLWSGAQPILWDRKANKGFATIPKTMPLILRIMDEMGNGTRLSET